jgi:hypothetical protein
MTNQNNSKKKFQNYPLRLALMAHIGKTGESCTSIAKKAMTAPNVVTRLFNGVGGVGNDVASSIITVCSLDGSMLATQTHEWKKKYVNAEINNNGWGD